MPALAIYAQLDTILPKRTEEYSERKLTQSDIKFVREEMGKIESVEDFMGNYRLLEKVLTAYGLEDEINKIGYIKRILTSDIGDAKSLVNVVSDDRYRDMASDLLFATGVSAAKADSTLQKIEDRLIKSGVEKELNEYNPGIRQAIIFEETAAKGNIKNTYDLIANPVLKEVIFGANNLPDILLAADVDALAKEFEKRVDVDKLTDDRYRERLVKRYLAVQDAAGTPAATSPSSAYGQILQGAVDNANSFAPIQLSVNLFV